MTTTPLGPQAFWCMISRLVSAIWWISALFIDFLCSGHSNTSLGRKMDNFTMSRLVSASFGGLSIVGMSVGVVVCVVFEYGDIFWLSGNRSNSSVSVHFDECPLQ